ncbi:MAG: hypothetical protein ACRCZF_18220, partial [Gemmataceae bacterium]
MRQKQRRLSNRFGFASLFERKLVLQELEGRDAPAVFTVTNTLDDSNPGSLRWAMEQANISFDVDVDEIQFNIPGAGPHTIVVDAGPLPTLLSGIKILGNSQPGYTGTPLVQLQYEISNHYGLNIDQTIHTHGAEIVGLAMYSKNTPNEAGIHISGSMNNVHIHGNYIGWRANGTSANGQFLYGILVNGDGSELGGTGWIGTNSDGVNDAKERNVIGGSRDTDVFISGIQDQLKVAGNYIGVGPDGQTAPITSASSGIGIGVNFYDNPDPMQSDSFGLLSGAEDLTIGGSQPHEQNVIAGHKWFHILLGSNADSKYNSLEYTQAVSIFGNRIGFDATGTFIVQPREDGMPYVGAQTAILVFRGSKEIQIGSGAAGTGNQIGSNGAGISSEGADKLTIQGNTIGLLSDGISSTFMSIGIVLNRGNYYDPITGDLKYFNTRSHFIGTNHDGINDETEGNTIAFQSSQAQNTYGIFSGGTDETTIAGNRFGMNTDGTDTAGSMGHGIYISSDYGNTPLDSVSITIGGTTPASKNYFGHVDQNGAMITLAARDCEPIILGNSFGLLPSGQTIDASSYTGVWILRTKSAQIGDDVVGGRNIFSSLHTAIRYNGSVGDHPEIVIQNNLIGDFTNEETFDRTLSSGTGISIQANADILIGGLTPLSRNVVAGNGVIGIHQNATSGKIVLQNNMIGTDANGEIVLGSFNGHLFNQPGIMLLALQSTTGDISALQIGGTL